MSVPARTRSKAKDTPAVAPDLTKETAPAAAPAAVSPAAPTKRVAFNRRGSDLSERDNPMSALRPRNGQHMGSDLRSRISKPARPGDTPIAIVDNNGHVMPFDAEMPFDRVILANVPGITYIYTQHDLQMVLQHNEEKIRQRRFGETLQGAAMFVPPQVQNHGFRSGAEVVAAMYNDTTMSNADETYARLDEML